MDVRCSVPDEFPFSKEMMKDPVVVSTGQGGAKKIVISAPNKDAPELDVHWRRVKTTTTLLTYLLMRNFGDAMEPPFC
ncbi:hypothetical protein QQ045_008739 [Rhodiola kirilowii]